MSALEANFDGLIGPTHNYAGLSYGNIASSSNALSVSNPKEAARQGLRKMSHLAGLGLMQGVLPPHQRPHLPTLRHLGFSGKRQKIIEDVSKEAPELLRNVYAASAMWTANAATLSPSADTRDGRVHFTPANLASMFHRSIEADTTAAVLNRIFADDRHFARHPPLPGGVHMGDEGAANHNRLCAGYADKGIEIFVYGKKAFDKGLGPKKFPARQSYEASRAIARLHGLDPEKTFFIQQNPDAIDGGAFHNDVVAVANRNVLFFHQQAFADTAGLKERLANRLPDFHFIEVSADAVPLADAVKSYLFNSQLLDVPGRDGMTLILPLESRETDSTRLYLEDLQSSAGPVSDVEFLDVRQSMRNGGGPACLRLRVVLTEPEQAALGGNVILTDKLFGELDDWIERHYRDRLAAEDFADPALMEESFAALDELTRILDLGALYDFQR